MHVAAWYRGTPGPKFTQITQHLYAPHPAIVSSRSPKQCTRKALHKIFYTFRYFPAPGRAAGRRSSLVLALMYTKAPSVYQKFRPVAFVTAWLTKNTKTSESAKDWCKSPHGIVGPPDQSLQNSGNKCRLAKPREILSPCDKKRSRYTLSKICAPEKVDQSSLKSLTIWHPPHMPRTMYRTSALPQVFTTRFATIFISPK